MLNNTLLCSADRLTVNVAYHSAQGTLHEHSLDEGNHPDSVHGGPSLSPALQRLQTGLQNLKYQHSALVQSLYTHPEQGPSLRSSPLLATAEEEEEFHTPSTGYSTLGKTSNRSHRLSSQSEASIWYDAQDHDGAEEFVLDDMPAEDGPSSASQMSGFSSPGTESTSASNDTEQDSGPTYDSETDTEEEVGREGEPSRAEATVLTPTEAQHVVRRTQLPSPPVGDEGSLFTVLKKNVGKACNILVLP